MKRIKSLFTAALLSGVAVTVHAQELKNYVQSCQTELEFAASEVKQMNCNDGYFFASSSRSGVNDYVVHQRVNQNVDMIAACRWGDSIFGLNQNTKFMSLELIIHNRVKGGTCFFAAKDVGTGDNRFRPVSTVIVPVTKFPDADAYWLKPSDMANKLLFSNGNPFGGPDYQEKLHCVRCHSQGPYIVSKRIAPFMANLGLINDGHHTYGDFSAPGHYYAVGSLDHTKSDPGTLPLGNWNWLIARNNWPGTGSCSSACHVLARDTVDPNLVPFFLPIGDLTSPLDRNAPVLPSIKTDINELLAGGMEPWEDDSPWHWINRDQPVSDSVEIETFTSSKLKYPVTQYCGNPTWLEANAVGTNAPFSTMEFSFMPNKLRSFNLRDGLLCMNSDQPGGQKCNDWQISYKCPITTQVPKWVGPYNRDTNFSDDGDHEERNSTTWNTAKAACGNKDPIAMRADALYAGSVVLTLNAPNDRLAQFTPSGLVCRNSDQGSGQSCASYVVRYRGCRPGNEENLARVKNAWTSPPTFGDRYLTTTNNVDGAETRAQANNYQYPSQDWTIQYMLNGNARLVDVWSGKYLTASGTADMTTVVVKNYDSAQLRQQWIVEKINGSSEVRFKNVGTNRYLTVGNYTNDPYYAPILSQTLSNQNWASQRWLIQ